MNRDDRVDLRAEIPYETKRALKEEDAPIWEIVDEAVRMYLGLDEQSTEAAVEAELESLREEEETLLNEIEELQAIREDKAERKEHLSEKLSDIQERRQSYKEGLDELLGEMLDEPNKTILAWTEDLKDLAQQEYGTGTDSNIDAVVADLRERRDEQHLAIPDHRFQRKTASRAVGQSTISAATDGGDSGPQFHSVSNDAPAEPADEPERIPLDLDLGDDGDESDDEDTHAHADDEADQSEQVLADGGTETTDTDSPDTDEDDEPTLMTDGGTAAGAGGNSRQNRELLDKCSELLRDEYREEIGELANKYPSEQQSIAIDWSDIHRFDMNLAMDVTQHPEEVRDHFEEALRLFDLPIDVDLDGARVRFKNIVDERELLVGEYNSNHIGELIGVRGQVRQISQSQAQLELGVFECQRCGTFTKVPQAGSDYQEPHECQGCERQGPFKPLKGRSKFADHQLVRLELPPEHAEGADSYIDAHLQNDLADELNGDERVRVTGKLDVDMDDPDGRDFPWRFLADHIHIEEGGYNNIDYTEYRDEIEYIKNKDDPIAYLGANVSPGLHRDEKLKTISEAFVCQEIGAAEKDGDGINFRSDSHGLAVGDPGTGKSELLEGINDIAPRSRFASGESVSGVGLTAAAERTDFGPGEWTVKAGLLPKTNNGVVCFDELDKTSEDDKKKLHSTLQRQKIDFSKAGQSATLRAKTTLLSAANPKHGRFDQYEPIYEQIGLQPALFSRFDLIFTVTDDPEREFDQEVAETVVDDWASAAAADTDTDAERDLSDEAYQAYFAYVKQEIEPTFTTTAKRRIISEYVSIRSQAYDNGENPVPLTARKLFAMLRLSESVARARASETVTEADAERAIGYIRTSLEDVGQDPETGELDADMVEAGTSKSQRERRKTIKAIVDDLAEEHDEGAPIEKVVEYAVDLLEISEEKAEHEVDELKQKGELFEPRTDYLRTT